VLNNHVTVTSRFSVVFWVNPASILSQTRISRTPKTAAALEFSRGRAKKTLEALANRFEQFIRPTEGFSVPPVPVTTGARYQKLTQLLTVFPNYEHSLWYQELLEECGRSGGATYKHLEFTTKEQIDAFFEQRILPLIDSLSIEGFIDNLSHDQPRGIIWSDGQIMKSIHGNHRFILAQLLELPVIPIELDAIHRDWWDTEFGGILTPKKLFQVGKRFSERVEVKER
jgi:hypothetical protein